MMKRLALGACLAVTIASSANARRTVDYSVDDATLATWATEQGVALTPFPASDGKTVVDIAPGVDHAVTSVGVFCSAWKIDNPVSQLIARAFPNPASSGPAASTGTRVRITSASTFFRCVGSGEMKSVCLPRVSIDATVSDGAGVARLIRVTVERAAKGVGACAGLTRGIALVSREAVAKLVKEITVPSAS